MTVTNELIDSLLAGHKKPEDLTGENDLLKPLTKKLVERALEAEMAEHLGYAKNETVAIPAGDNGNGKSRKTLKGDFGELPIEMPRDRQGSVEPQIVTKHQTRWAGFDDKMLSLYAPGMTVRDSESPARDVWRGGIADTDFLDHRCCHGRCQSLACPDTGRAVPTSTWTASMSKPAMQALCVPRRCTWYWEHLPLMNLPR